MKVKIKNESCFENPTYKTKGSVGMDLKADLSLLNSENWEEKLQHRGNIQVDFNYEETVIEGNFLAANPVKSIELRSHSRVIIPTNISIQLPDGFEAKIRPRSGLSFDTGLNVVLGTIDSDYIGKIGIICTNPTNNPITINHGDRIAQMVVSVVDIVEWENVKKLKPTERGEGGFGHTGKN